MNICSPLPPGAQLNNGTYRLDSLLGAGGFGITYRGHDTVLDRPVGIKEFFPADCARQGRKLREGGHGTAAALADHKRKFLKEGQKLARLHHSGIVQIHTIFEENDTVYLVMQFVEGQSLEEYRRAHGGRLPVPEALDLIRQTGAGLAEVHAAGLLHRDIKPANIMRRANGQVVLIDFGAAREFTADTLHTQTVVLTRGFAPPEQYDPKGKRGPFTDVYALSATLYCLLGGDPPTDSMIRLHEDNLPSPRSERPDVPAAVSDAVMRGLCLKVAGRPATVEAFLAEFTSGGIVVAEPPKTRINPVDGSEMIYIPPGWFIMGPHDSEEREKPQRNVYLDGYYIAKNLVTVAQYRRFCGATRHPPPPIPPWGWDGKENYPVVDVSWDDAQAYCLWAGCTLPTDEQWEKAARGPNALIYPWGNTWDPAKCRCSRSYGDAGSPSPVGSYPDGASPYGVLDMAGNVWQWCDDLYDNLTGHVAVAGGSWGNYSDDYYFRCAFRTGRQSDYATIDVGFRCVSHPG